MAHGHDTATVTSGCVGFLAAGAQSMKDDIVIPAKNGRVN
jgi:hypothetical protein